MIMKYGLSTLIPCVQHEVHGVGEGPHDELLAEEHHPRGEGAEQPGQDHDLTSTGEGAPTKAWGVA